MKRMKLYIGACLGTALISLSSCEPNMVYTNPSADSELTYYNTQEHLTYAVNGAYNMLQRAGGWARWMPFMLNARSDEYAFTSGAANGEPETARLAQYTVNADLGSMSATYQDLYTLQYAANLALERLEINQDGAFNLDDAEDKKLYDRLRGEAIFLRGLSRFYLVYFFGDEIPDRDYVTTGGDDYLLPPAEPGQIYQRMIQDFKDASELLTEWNYEGTEDEGRATKGSALAFLAKVLRITGFFVFNLNFCPLSKTCLIFLFPHGKMRMLPLDNIGSHESNRLQKSRTFDKSGRLSWVIRLSIKIQNRKVKPVVCL